MKKILITIFITLFLISLVVVIARDESFQGAKKEHSVELYPPEYWEFSNTASVNAYAQDIVYSTATYGSIAIETQRSRYRNTASYDIWVYNLDQLDNDEIYEVWFVDDDTGYKLTGGVFTVDSRGDERHSASFTTYLDVYDRVVVTVEPYPDEDPNPSGEIALIADINLEHLIKRRVSMGESYLS